MSLERIQAKVNADDYNYLLLYLGGGEHGLQQHIVSHLFHHFANYIRTLNLPPYDDRPRTAQQLRNLATIANITSGPRPDGIS